MCSIDSAISRNPASEDVAEAEEVLVMDLRAAFNPLVRNRGLEQRGTRLDQQSRNRTAAGYAVPMECYTPASA
jgi:hypothetical protein